MKKKDMKYVPFINWKKYDNDNFYIVFFDYNEGERVIINNKYISKLLDICNNNECDILSRKSHVNNYKDLDVFKKILDKYNIEYQAEWFDIEY